MAETQERIVGFIDILGFKDMVQKYDSGQEPELLDNLVEIVNTAGEFLKRELPIPHNSNLKNWKKHLEVKVFSDCFCISVPLEHPNFNFSENVKLFYQYISGFQVLFLERGYLVRGGLTIGSYYSDENLIFSGGLVEAYEMESEIAKMPRIIVSDKFLQAINDNKCYYASYMFKLEGDHVFVNPFNHSLIDADFFDKMVEEYFSVRGELGTIVDSFKDLDEADKLNTLNTILKWIEPILNEELNEKITSKYNWLKEFIKNEKGEESELSFEEYKII